MPETPPLPNARHSLTLEFRRVLSEAEWREVVEAARQLPYVQGLQAEETDLAELTRLRAERDRIQHDFADDLADRRGDLYEQIKDLVAQFYVEREERDELQAALTEVQHRALAAEQERDALHAKFEELRLVIDVRAAGNGSCGECHTTDINVHASNCWAGRLFLLASAPPAAPETTP